MCNKIQNLSKREKKEKNSENGSNRANVDRRSAEEKEGDKNFSLEIGNQEYLIITFIGKMNADLQKTRMNHKYHIDMI